MKKTVFLSVTNDLFSELRVNNIATTLAKNGYEVRLIGRKSDIKIAHNDFYTVKRIKCLFNSGFMFYAEFNIKLFLYLLFRKYDILVANDLDTLLANSLASRIKRVPLVYDSHEYFTEVPELNSKKRVKNFWLSLEKRFLPKIKYAYTVCDSIAKEYNKIYGVDFKVVRNLPTKEKSIEPKEEIIDLKSKFPNKKIILYQGALNENRGIEYMIKTIQHVNDAVFVIIGKGYMKLKLQELVLGLKLTKKVFFIDAVPYSDLHFYTKQADLGISLEEYTCKSYYYSLTNKLFNYISCGVPVLIADLPEMRKIVLEYEVGIVSESYHPLMLAEKINKLFSNDSKYETFKANTLIAAKELCWENEEKKIIEIYEKVQ